MKKIFLFVLPIISYLSAYGITKIEEQDALLSDTLMKTFVFRCIFFMLLGFLLCCFYKCLLLLIKDKVANIICFIAILLPIVIWIYLINYGFIINFNYYLLVYFLYLGAYVNSIITYIYKKEKY